MRYTARKPRNCQSDAPGFRRFPSLSWMFSYAPIWRHMSIAGGYYKALVAAHEYRCETVQLFTKNFPNLHWQAATWLLPSPGCTPSFAILTSAGRMLRYAHN